MAEGARDGIARRVALGVAAVAVLRVVLHALLDQRPRFGGSEANDLVHLVRHHWHLRGYEVGELGVGLLEDRYKPPLYYGGLPAAWAGHETLTYAPLLLVNALTLALALGAAWWLGCRLAGPRAGVWSVAVLAGLPAVAGRSTFVGVEPLHLAALLGLLVGLVALRQRRRALPAVLGTASVLAAAVLVKWTFLAAAVGPFVVEGVAALRRGDRGHAGRLVAAAGLAALPVLAWLVAIGGPGAILAGAAEDPTTAELAGGPVWLFLPRWAVVEGLGLAGLAALWMGAWGWGRDRAVPGGWLLGAPVVVLLVVHQLIPHKEVRYLLPAFGPAAVAIGLGMARLDARRGGTRLAARAVMAVLLGGTLVAPQLRASAFDTTEPPDSRLRLAISRDDGGLGPVVEDSSWGTVERPVVLTSWQGDRWLELQDLWTWELYGRGRHPVVVLPPQPDLRWSHARAELDRATHYLTNRELGAEETAALRAAGFTEVLRAAVAIPESPRVELWAKVSP